MSNELAKIVKALQTQEIIAIPTESIYGLSCVITPEAVTKIINIKQRSNSKGFIIVSSKLDHFLPFIDETK